MKKNQKSPLNQDAESLYLSHLTFDETQRGKWIEVLFKNARLLVLLIVGIIFFGLYSFSQLPRELNPEVVIPAVNVITVLPGAAPKDVEALVTQKLEKAAPNLPNLDSIGSSSTQGLSIITFQFNSNQDADEAARLTKEEIDVLLTELPEDATDPRVEKLNINDQPFLTVALTGPISRLSLSRIAENLKDRLEQTSGIRKVTLSGHEVEEIVIELNPATLKTYNLSEQTIIQALRANNLTFPTGNVTVGNLEYTLSLDSELNTLEKIRSLVVNTGGEPIVLGQVASVYLRTKEITNFQAYQDRETPLQNAIQLSVFKAEGETIDSAAENTRQVLKEELADYSSIKVVDILDFSKDITDQFTELQENFLQSVLLLFVVLAIFLGVRQASVAALSIPLVIMCTFIFMHIFGITLNFLSLFSLLLALSLIGDDAIVMAQSTTAYGRKFNSIETGLMVFKDFFIPIWVGTITVVWSFIPLLLASGIIGEFIKPIPLVVTATLLSSTAIATLLNLPLNVVLRDAQIPFRLKFLLSIFVVILSLVGVWFLVSGSQLAVPVISVYLILLVALFFARTQVTTWLTTSYSKLSASNLKVKKTFTWIKERQVLSNSLISITPIINWYRGAVQKIVSTRSYRWLTFGVVVLLLIISGVFAVTGLLKSEFFPATDENTMFVNIEGPAGWQVKETEEVIRIVEQKALETPEVKSMNSAVGSTFSQGFGGGGSGGNRANITLTLEDRDERERTSTAIAAELRQRFKNFQLAKVTIQEMSGGPPTGASFQVNIKGNSLEELEQIADDFQAMLQEIPGAINISSSLKLSAGQIKVELNHQELAERGLTAQQVGTWLRTVLSGTEASDTIIETEDLDIIVQLESPSQNLELLSNLALPSNLGTYTLAEVATLTLENSPTVSERQDNQRVVRVTADGENISSPEMLQAFQEKVASYDLPRGYTWDVGGENEENEESVQSIILAMRVSFFLILITLVLQLRSFRKAVMVLVVIPLAMIGVIINFTLFGIPLSFPALIGVLSLFGIVVNNALMVVEKINLNLEHGFTTEEAVVDGASSRLEAIFLSSFASIIGLLPVTISNPLWQGLGGAIIAGLTVSGLLILFLLPAMYIEVYGRKEASR